MTYNEAMEKDFCNIIISYIDDWKHSFTTDQFIADFMTCDEEGYRPTRQSFLNEITKGILEEIIYAYDYYYGTAEEYLNEYFRYTFNNCIDNNYNGYKRKCYGDVINKLNDIINNNKDITNYLDKTSATWLNNIVDEVCGTYLNEFEEFDFGF